MNLTTNTYGRTDDYPDYEVCVIAGNYFDGFWWHTMTYYCLWLLCIVLMGVMYFRIACLRTGELAISVDKFRLATKTLGKYPIALFVFWLPHMLSVSFGDLVSTGQTDFYVIALIAKLLHGVATTLIFFFDSSEARYHWFMLFNAAWLAIFPKPDTADDADRSSVDPSRWGVKLFSLTYDSKDAADTNYDDSKMPTFTYNPSTTSFRGESIVVEEGILM